MIEQALLTSVYPVLQVVTVHLELRQDPTPFVKAHLIPIPPLRNRKSIKVETESTKERELTSC